MEVLYSDSLGEGNKKDVTEKNVAPFCRPGRKMFTALR